MLFKAVRLHALQDTPSAFGSTYAKECLLTDQDWVARTAQWSSERSIAYVAMDGQVACGIAGAFLDRENAGLAHLISMWTAPEYRRQGVGRLLVNGVQSWASACRAHALQLMVTSNNESALQFYRSLGFAPTGRTEPYPNDPLLMELEMICTIA